jgi:hypothetical protein
MIAHRIQLGLCQRQEVANIQKWRCRECLFSILGPKLRLSIPFEPRSGSSLSPFVDPSRLRIVDSTKDFVHDNAENTHEECLGF